MSLRTFLASRVTRALTSQAAMEKRRSKADTRRERRGEALVIDYFHDASDPYSHLVAQILPELIGRYEIDVRPHLVSPPPDWAAPDREKLVAYSRLDAERLARKAGLAFTDPGEQPSSGRLKLAEAALARTIANGTFCDEAARIGQWLWTGEGSPPAGGGNGVEARKTGDARRDEAGHYLAATFHLDGEWFWGLDRLHYLEARLVKAGKHLPGAPDAPIFPPPALVADPSEGPEAKGQTLHFYLSFRSPYTYIATERVRALADAYGAELKLRFVLPMVMRGMQVPRTKGLYILKDTAREAHRLGIPFGKVADPVGEPVERGYSILPWAIEQGRGYDFALSFMRGVWAEGIDAGSDGGLKTIVTRAGLDWKTAKSLIGTSDWKPIAESNRTEMMGLGLWGVPSFRVGDVATWGQDRLWLIEEALSAWREVGSK